MANLSPHLKEGDKEEKERDYVDDLVLILIMLFLVLPLFLAVLYCVCHCFNTAKITLRPMLRKPDAETPDDENPELIDPPKNNTVNKKYQIQLRVAYLDPYSDVELHGAVCFPRRMETLAGFPRSRVGVSNNNGENNTQPQNTTIELKQLEPLELTGMAAACNHYLRTVVHNDQPPLQQDVLIDAEGHHLSEAANAFSHHQNNIQCQNITSAYGKVVNKDLSSTAESDDKSYSNHHTDLEKPSTSSSENSSKASPQNKLMGNNIKETPQDHKHNCCPHANQPQHVITRMYNLPSPMKSKMFNDKQMPLDNACEPVDPKHSTEPDPQNPPNSDLEIDSPKPKTILGAKMMKNHEPNNNLSTPPCDANTKNSSNLSCEDFEACGDWMIDYNPDLEMINSIANTTELPPLTTPANGGVGIDTTMAELLLAQIFHNALTPDSVSLPDHLDALRDEPLGFEECIYSSDPNCSLPDPVELDNVIYANPDPEVPSTSAFPSTFLIQGLPGSSNPMTDTNTDSIPIPYPMGGASRLIYYRNSHIDVQDLQGSNPELAQTPAASNESLLSADSEVPQNPNCPHNQFNSCDHCSQDKE